MCSKCAHNLKFLYCCPQGHAVGVRTIGVLVLNNTGPIVICIYKLDDLGFGTCDAALPVTKASRSCCFIQYIQAALSAVVIISVSEGSWCAPTRAHASLRRTFPKLSTTNKGGEASLKSPLSLPSDCLGLSSARRFLLLQMDDWSGRLLGPGKASSFSGAV